MIKKQFNGIFNNKKVLITGHTGFKGSWLSLILHKLGADVYGYALEPPTNPSLFKEARIYELVTSHIGDIRNFDELLTFLDNIEPEVIFHMAAQSLVRESYSNPVETYEINVIGTVNLFEAIRQASGIKAVINVTTDKCYENQEWLWGYRENDQLGGFDPYSNSKACSELVTSSFRDSFFNPKDYDKHGVAVATARAGNVIGGGDWAPDRLIPDFIKAISENVRLKIRSPFAIRPWQHVMDPLTGYLLLGEKLITEGLKFAEAWNFGPNDTDSKNVEWIIKQICQIWGKNAFYDIDNNPQPYEANYLKLDCSKAKTELDWFPKWDIKKALDTTVRWNKERIAGKDTRKITEAQIAEYFNI